MDRTLFNLLLTFWATGDRAIALVLADRLHELSSEQVADVLIDLRASVQPRDQRR